LKYRNASYRISQWFVIYDYTETYIFHAAAMLLIYIQQTRIP